MGSFKHIHNKPVFIFMISDGINDIGAHETFSYYRFRSEGQLLHYILNGMRGGGGGEGKQGYIGD